jgi:bifunctional enzyme CysN/CysC
MTGAANHAVAKEPPLADENERVSALATTQLLRLSTAGSVDDGKSTLIGRLLYETKSIFEDQLEAIDRASRDQGLDRLNLALLTDGLRAEREQGITIDVAYRYFSTPRRSFVLADTPGHVEYTRNMVTGASTVDLTIVLVDASRGVAEQSRRHLFLAALLDVRHVVVCVNKMDLVGYDRAVFEGIRDELETFVSRLDLTDVRFIPISALEGDNVVDRSANTPWYDGATLLDLLESVPIGRDRASAPARCTRATRWSCCRADGAPASPRSTPSTARSTRQ